MTSAVSAVEAAAYTALSSSVSLATVYQHVPENAPVPCVVIGDLEATPLESKGDTDRDVSLTVSTITQGEEREPCLNIMAQVETALDGLGVSRLGWDLSFRLTSESAVILPDGITYVGTQTFSVFALS